MSRSAGYETEVNENRWAGHVGSADGTTIRYDFYPTGSRRLVLVVPGFWRNRRYPSMVHLAGFLNRGGYDVAVVDVRGHGDSEGVYGFNLHEQEDIYAVARQLLETQRPTGISVIGFSVGGGIAISTVARHLNLPWVSLFLISPVADFRMIVPRINPFTVHRHLSATAAMQPPSFDWRFLRSAKLRPADDIQKVPIPVAFVHVKNDWLVHHRNSLLLYEQAHEPKELHLIDMSGCYHADRILVVAKEKIEGLMSEFLQRTFEQKHEAALSRGL